MKRFLIPLALFLVLAGFLAVGLQHDPRELPSPLVGKPAPDFNLPRLAAGPAGEDRFTPAQMRGQVWLLNVFASWCVACREEHPVLLELARSKALPLVGLAYKDAEADSRRWLAQLGNPYLLEAVDRDGRVGIDYGVYGVPETYLIDKAGMIRFKQVGPVTPQVLRDTILPMAKELQK